MLSDHRRTTYTKGDQATQPGGVCLRHLRGDKWAAYHFTRNPGEHSPKSYFWGRYGNFENALAAYNEKVKRVQGFVVTADDILTKGM